MATEESTEIQSPDDEIEIEVTRPDEWLSVVAAEEKTGENPLQIYASKEIQSKANVTKIQLINWTQRGAIIPLKDAKGRGGRRIYSHQNLIEAMICRELNRFSIQSHNMKAALEFLKEKIWTFKFSALDYSREATFARTAEEITGKTINIDPMSERVGQMIKNREIPRRLTRKHTVWEFLSLYPTRIADLLLAFYTRLMPSSEDESKKDLIFSGYLYEAGNILNVLVYWTSSVIINLSELKSEAER